MNARISKTLSYKQKTLCSLLFRIINGNESVILLNTNLSVQNKPEIRPFLFPYSLKTLLKTDAEKGENMCDFFLS
jgi:hypothetical protein